MIFIKKYRFILILLAIIIIFNFNIFVYNSYSAGLIAAGGSKFLAFVLASATAGVVFNSLDASLQAYFQSENISNMPEDPNPKNSIKNVLLGVVGVSSILASAKVLHSAFKSQSPVPIEPDSNIVFKQTENINLGNTGLQYMHFDYAGKYFYFEFAHSPISYFHFYSDALPNSYRRFPHKIPYGYNDVTFVIENSPDNYANFYSAYYYSGNYTFGGARWQVNKSPMIVSPDSYTTTQNYNHEPVEDLKPKLEHIISRLNQIDANRVSKVINEDNSVSYIINNYSNDEFANYYHDNVTLPEIIQSPVNYTITEVAGDTIINYISDPGTLPSSPPADIPVVEAYEFPMDNFFTRFTESIKNLFIPQPDYILSKFNNIRLNLAEKYQIMDLTFISDDFNSLSCVPLPNLYFRDYLIVDTSYVNNMAETIREWQSYLWYIILVLFNVNNVHKLIRGVGMVDSKKIKD